MFRIRQPPHPSPLQTSRCTSLDIWQKPGVTRPTKQASCRKKKSFLCFCSFAALQKRKTHAEERCQKDQSALLLCRTLIFIDGAKETYNPFSAQGAGFNSDRHRFTQTPQSSAVAGNSGSAYEFEPHSSRFALALQLSRHILADLWRATADLTLELLLRCWHSSCRLRRKSIIPHSSHDLLDHKKLSDQTAWEIFLLHLW